jgi:hypothetical protein
MTLSNLPPGVTDSMIPGNRAEDIEKDQYLETLCETINKKIKSLEKKEKGTSNGQTHAILNAEICALQWVLLEIYNCEIHK